MSVHITPARENEQDQVASARDAFGHWLSGLTDGEGCFTLHMRRAKAGGDYYPKCRFTIALRGDDREILEEIRRFWGCGSLGINLKRDRAPQVRYCVETLDALTRVLIRHFDRYPLRAKKARDYAIWREATLLCADVFRRPLPSRKGRSVGAAPRWTPADRLRFVSLKESLRVVRHYRPTLEP